MSRLVLFQLGTFVFSNIFKRKIALDTDSIYRFTTRGIVAFVFSCITGTLGVLVVAWYGMSQPIKSESAKGPFGEVVITNGGTAAASTSANVISETEHSAAAANSREETR